MKTEKIRIACDSGISLGGRIDLPDNGNPAVTALFAHCFTCTKNLTAAGNISRALTQAGWAVLRFDFAGLGESEGDFADTSFSSNVDDLVSAAGALAGRYAPPALLVGHSLGGAAVLQAAHRVPSVQAVATVGAPAEPSHVKKLLRSAEEEINREGEAEVVLAGRSFRIKKQFLEDLEETRMSETIAALKPALLVCHSPTDDTVGVENARQIFETARHPKSFLSLAGADHLLSRREDSLYVGTVIAAWSTRFVTNRAV